jgi:hypothetical protein
MHVSSMEMTSPPPFTLHRNALASSALGVFGEYVDRVRFRLKWLRRNARHADVFDAVTQ